MYITQCLFAFLSLYAGLSHSFSWEIVTRTSNQLQFYDVNGNLTHREYVATGSINTITYDPVHNRVLFADRKNIYSFEITSKTIETLVTNTTGTVTTLTYDPATDLLFWNEYYKGIHSMSLKTGLSNRRNEKQSMWSDDYIYDMTVDICGGFIHWISERSGNSFHTSDFNLQRAHFDGSGREVVNGRVSTEFINIDHHTQKMYWYEPAFDRTILGGFIKCADLNGENSREVFQVRRPQLMAISKDHFYLKICAGIIINCNVWKIPKNRASDIVIFNRILMSVSNYLSPKRLDLMKPNLFVEDGYDIVAIAAKYSIEDVTRGVQNCDRLKSLLPNTTVTNVSSDVSLLCVHGTKVSGESRCECTQGYSGERCDVSV